MNILDENIPESQRQQLQAWRIRVRQIGHDLGRSGMKDQDQVIPLLRSRRHPVLFTRDLGLFDPDLCHERYAIICIAAAANESANLIRRFLRHPAFNSKAKRSGIVAKVSEKGIRVWSRGHEKAVHFDWSAFLHR